jgi:hypothetical protein
MESKPLLLLEPQCRKDQRIVASNKIVKLKGGGEGGEERGSTYSGNCS